MFFQMNILMHQLEVMFPFPVCHGLYCNCCGYYETYVFERMLKITLSITLYLTEVLLVSSSKNNVHCIRHDMDGSLVFLPGFQVGFLKTKCSCCFDILDIKVREELFMLFSQPISTLSIIWLLAAASVRSMECMSLVNFKLLGC